MPPIDTSLDLLYIALAVVVVVVGFFVAWSLYYLVMTLKDTRMVTRDIRKRVEAFWEVIELLRDKLQVGGAVFKLAATGIKELAEHVRAYSEGEKKTKKSKKKKKDDEE